MAGPFALVIDLVHFYSQERIGYHGNSLRMLKIFTLLKIRLKRYMNVADNLKNRNIFFFFRNFIAEIFYIIPRCSSLLFSIFFVFYIFSYIGHELFSRSFPEYFGTMSNAMLSMFQVIILCLRFCNNWEIEEKRLT